MDRPFPTRAELGLKVLLAEDADDNQRLICKLLSRLGCEVTAVGDGKSATNVLETSDGFDLVLLDMIMPVMDGFEAAERIRQMHADLPIVAMTAMNQPDERNRCLAAGCNGFLAKPIDRGKLYSLLSRISSTASRGQTPDARR